MSEEEMKELIQNAFQRTLKELKENAKYHTDSYLNSGVGKAILRAINEEL